jgi:uncharacterized repeat protein (TIGR03806 family)
MQLCLRRILRLGSSVAAVAMLSGCGGSEPPAEATPGKMPYETLSTYGFFAGEMAKQDPAPGVVPYEVAAPLWSDGAAKKRFVVLPEGGKIGWTERDEWSLPVGSVLIKTFLFPDDLREASGPARIIETRLLIHEEEGWTGHVYVWNEAQTEATRLIAGKRVDVSFIDEEGAARTQEYVVPNTNQCKSCHERDDELRELGMTTHQMNREVMVEGAAVNQLDWLKEKGVFGSAPPPSSGEANAFPDPFGDGPIESRARAYLAGNCSHCHRPGGGGGDSGLVLLAWEENLPSMGVCKGPAAAGSGTGGHSFDIVPGAPESSIMIFRMSSVDPEIKMPELPNLVSDKKGVELISAWIAGMEPKGCP